MALIPPTRVLIAQPAVGFGSAATSKTSTSFNVSVGDMVVVQGVTQGATSALTVPTASGGGITWTTQVPSTVANYCSNYIWTGVVTVAESITVTVANTGNAAQNWSFIAQVWRGVGGLGAFQKTNNAANAPANILITTGDNSAIVYSSGDFIGTDGSARAWRVVNGTAVTEAFFYGGTYAAYFGYVTDAGTAGNKNVGLTAPATQKYSTIALELFGIAETGSGPLNVAGTGTPFFGAGIPKFSYSLTLSGTGTPALIKSSAVSDTLTVTGVGTVGFTGKANYSAAFKVTGTGTVKFTRSAGTKILFGQACPFNDTGPAPTGDGPDWAGGILAIEGFAAGSAPYKYISSTRIYGIVNEKTGLGAETLLDKKNLIVQRWNEGVVCVVSINVVNSDYDITTLNNHLNQIYAAGVRKMYLAFDHEPMNNYPDNVDVIAGLQYSFTPAQWTRANVDILLPLADTFPWVIPTIIYNGFAFYGASSFNSQRPDLSLTPELMNLWSNHPTANLTIDAYTADGFNGGDVTKKCPADSLPFFINWCQSNYPNAKHFGIGEFGVWDLGRFTRSLQAVVDARLDFCVMWNHRKIGCELIDAPGNEKLSTFKAFVDQSNSVTAPPPAAIGVFGTSFFEVGANSTNTGTINLPEILENGYLYLKIGWNLATVSVTTDLSAWTLLTPLLQDGATMNALLYGRLATPADSLTSLTITLSSGARWEFDVSYHPRSTGPDVIVPIVSSTASTAVVIPAATPTVDDGNDMILLWNRYNDAAGGFVNIPAPFNKRVDTCTSQLASPWYGGLVATHRFTGQGGTAQAAITTTANQNQRFIGWRVESRGFAANSYADNFAVIGSGFLGGIKGVPKMKGTLAVSGAGTLISTGVSRASLAITGEGTISSVNGKPKISSSGAITGAGTPAWLPGGVGTGALTVTGEGTPAFVGSSPSSGVAAIVGTGMPFFGAGIPGISYDLATIGVGTPLFGTAFSVTAGFSVTGLGIIGSNFSSNYSAALKVKGVGTPKFVKSSGGSQILWGQNCGKETATDGPSWDNAIRVVEGFATGTAPYKYISSTRQYNGVSAAGTNAETILSAKSTIVQRWNEGVVTVLSLNVTNTDFDLTLVNNHLTQIYNAGVRKLFLVMDHEPMNDLTPPAGTYGFNWTQWRATQINSLLPIADTFPWVIPTIIYNGYPFYGNSSFNNVRPDLDGLTPAVMTPWSNHPTAVLAVDCYTADGFAGGDVTKKGPADSLPFFINWCKTNYPNSNHFGIGEMGVWDLGRFELALQAVIDARLDFCCLWNHRQIGCELIDAPGNEKLTAFKAAVNRSGAVTPPPAPVGVLDSASFCTNLNTVATGSLNFPEILTNGYLYLRVGWNSVNSDVSAALAGWTPLGFLQDGATMNTRLYGRKCTPADSNANLTVTMTFACRYEFDVTYHPGSGGPNVISTVISSTPAATYTVPDVTPLVDDGVDMLLLQTRYNDTSTGAMTPTAGWTKRVDASTNQAAGPWYGGAVITRPFSGQADLPQGDATGTVNQNLRFIGWRILSQARTPYSYSGLNYIIGTGTIGETFIPKLNINYSILGTGTPAFVGNGIPRSSLSISGDGIIRFIGNGVGAAELAVTGVGTPAFVGAMKIAASLAISGIGTPLLSKIVTVPNALAVTGSGAISFGLKPMLKASLAIIGVGTPMLTKPLLEKLVTIKVWNGTAEVACTTWVWTGTTSVAANFNKVMV